MSSRTVVTRFVERWSKQVDPVEFTRQERCEDRVVCRILLADQHLSWRCGCPRELDYYLKSWPIEMRSSEDFLQLLIDEFGYREQAGHDDSIDAFLSELTDLSDSLREQLARNLCDDPSDRVDRSAQVETHADPQRRATLPPNSRYSSPQQASTRYFSGSDRSDDSGEHSIPNLPRIKIEEKLGEGAFGAVYLARDLELERPVAIKVLHSRIPTSSSRVASLIDEARKIAQLDCPGIVPVYQAGRAVDGRPFMIFKFVPGGDLRRITRQGAWEKKKTLRLMRGCARALESAHMAGIIHRDIKPANILIDDDGSPWITDFGLAAFEKDIQDCAGEITGTPAYMSPEQTLGHYDQLDGRTDIWSLGVIMYELLTGRLPFPGDSFDEIFEKIRTSDPIPIRMSRPEISPSLEEVCDRCLAKDIADRFASAKCFGDELDKLLRELDSPLIEDQGNADQASLVFHILGTPYSYVPSPECQRFTVGRQRRKSPESPRGCDFVIRCIDGAAQSLQISRTHLEIVREDKNHYVIDRSKLGTHLNGQRIPQDQPTRIKGGDQLVIADVLTLQILSSAEAATGTPIKAGTIAAPGKPHEGYIVEASMGDLTTIEPSH